MRLAQCLRAASQLRAGCAARPLLQCRAVSLRPARLRALHTRSIRRSQVHLGRKAVARESDMALTHSPSAVGVSIFTVEPHPGAQRLHRLSRSHVSRASRGSSRVSHKTLVDTTPSRYPSPSRYSRHGQRDDTAGRAGGRCSGRTGAAAELAAAVRLGVRGGAHFAAVVQPARAMAAGQPTDTGPCSPHGARHKAAAGRLQGRIPPADARAAAEPAAAVEQPVSHL